MDSFSVLVLAIIWIGAVLSAVSGVVWNPNMLIRRKDNPKVFWTAYWVAFFYSVVVTVFIFVLSR